MFPSCQRIYRKRNLDNSILEIGYNSGQFHHGERKTEELINNALQTRLLLDKGLISYRTKEKAYQVFANKCIIFPLKDRKNRIVSLYVRSILEKGGKHFYLKNRSGIYPGYPNPETKKLILTEAIIDAASSLLQIKNIAGNYSIVACFGTNGLNEEILQAIKELKELEEIIFCFDQDKAGKEAVEKYAELLKDHLSSKQTGLFLGKEAVKDHLQTASLTVRFSIVELPCNDVNETLQLYNEEIFTELLDRRIFIFSDKNVSNTVISTQTIQSTEKKILQKQQVKK
ncbi:toprim domain-containing protein [Chryseobacterium culicis]|uniref:DNA primase catalytic core, N-terminal domain n=1 Tax=Chryseobacterium culicis TaxID=680127 RepID=A0A1H6H8N9_CHRCI|nr:toprim domain-containing protein [Chryseobacterium culicis]SEH31856.1 DNA primase catalytic core, N-terminal domain [Chryseobacterium culicis]